MKKHPFAVGKLPLDYLRELLARAQIRDPRVVIGPRVGEDAAVIDFGGKYLVVKTDPITFATEDIGRYAVNINANDVATMGARPKWFLVTVMLPEGTADPKMVEGILDGLLSACNDLNISLCGGHTEVTPGLSRPILIGQMLGEVDKGNLVDKRSLKPGDDVILTKGIAIEGTAIIAREMPDKLAEAPKQTIRRAQRLLRDPGVSVVKEAMAAVQTARVHAMHDPTEGGLSGGLYELAEAGGVGFEVDEAKISVLETTERICAELGLNPLGLIASGALLICTDPGDTSCVCSAIEAKGVACQVIGFVTDLGRGVVLKHGPDLIPFPRFERDEITRVIK